MNLILIGGLRVRAVKRTMVYKEDKNLPEWMINGDTSIEKEFEEWYNKEFLITEKHTRSPRYYQMRRAWIASKKYYSQKDGETQ